VLGKPGDMIQKFMPFLLNTDCHQNFLWSRDVCTKIDTSITAMK
jgi:hypothetical protein